MIKKLTTTDVADALRRDEYGGWSWAGAQAMARYLEQVEEDLGEEMELDVVAIRCDYSEHASLREWAEGYFGGNNWREDAGLNETTTDEEDEQILREYIEDNGTLIEFDGGIIVSSF